VIRILWRYKYIFFSVIIVSFILSLIGLRDIKIFYDTERIIELSNESKDIIDKSLDDQNLILLAIEFKDSLNYQNLVFDKRDITHAKTKSKIFDYIKNDRTFFEREPLQKISKINQLYAFKHKGFWQCMDTLRDKELLENGLKKIKNF
jgi:NDP-sugar pyrophosphorylase family protein